MNDTATYEWTMVYAASRRSYTSKTNCPNKFYPSPIWRPLKISPPKVEKPKYETELDHHANFHADQREISVAGQTFLPRGLLWRMATVPCYTFLNALVDTMLLPI